MARIDAFLDLLFRESAHGLVLETGAGVLIASPAGNGRTTTLAALADHLARTRADSVLTIESPVEFHLSHRQALQSARAQGMIPLAESLAELVRKKRVDPSEASARVKT